MSFTIPEVSDVDVAFPTGTKHYLKYGCKELEPFTTTRNVFTKKAMDLFYKGGSLTDNNFKYKPEFAPQEMRTKVNKFFRVIIGTWHAKHEHKKAMAGYVLSQVLDYTPNKK